MPTTMLIVRLLQDVASNPLSPCVRGCRGELVEAERNPHGAVSATIRGGWTLRLKPDEFEVVCDSDQVGWWNPGSQRFCYLDEKEGGPEKLYRNYTVAVFGAGPTAVPRPLVEVPDDA
jgi:hypothetical protein